MKYLFFANKHPRKHPPKIMHFSRAVGQKWLKMPPGKDEPTSTRTRGTAGPRGPPAAQPEGATWSKQGIQNEWPWPRWGWPQGTKKKAIRWVNRNRARLFKRLCSCQEEWARDVRAAVPPGSRTKH